MLWARFFDFDFGSAKDVPFGILQYILCILFGLTSVLLCVPFIFADSESVDLVFACEGLLCVTEIIHIFYSGYLDFRSAFQLGLDSYCCVMS